LGGVILIPSLILLLLIFKVERKSMSGGTEATPV
jgi:hypothetical protein